MRSHSERRAVQAKRLNYWNGASYSTVRIKASNKCVFECNGCVGKDVYIHPCFVPFLHYFLFGADLRDAVINAFEEGVGNPDWVKSSDIVPIGRLARDHMCQHRLDKVKAGDEQV